MPLSGRKIWLAGIGGAGMSGYGILAKAWGADVSGWDRRETPYLEGVRAAGIPVEISDGPPEPPADAEAFVSTAFAGRVKGEPAPSSLPSSSASRTPSSSPAHTARRQPPR